jgi:hypothetical protein
MVTVDERDLGQFGIKVNIRDAQGVPGDGVPIRDGQPRARGAGGVGRVGVGLPGVGGQVLAGVRECAVAAVGAPVVWQSADHLSEVRNDRLEGGEALLT